MTRGPRIAHDLVVGMDYGQFLIRGGEAEYCPDDATLLSEAHADGEGVAADGRTVLVWSPRQFDFAMTLRVEIWDRAPTDDLDGWQEAFETALEVNAEGRLRFDSPTMMPVECAVPPGRYQVLITGRGVVPFSSPAATGGGDSWRVQLWLTASDTVTRRLRSSDPSWKPSTAPAAGNGRRWNRDPEGTAWLHTELLERSPADACCRRAEAAALLRLTRDASDLRAQVAGRLEVLLGSRATHPDLLAELGLTNSSGVPVRGLPAGLMNEGRCCAAAAWRGALSVGGELIVRSDRLQVLARCAAAEPSMVLVGLGRRIGIPEPVLREDLGVLVKDGPALLGILGADQTLAALRVRNT